MPHHSVTVVCDVDVFAIVHIDIDIFSGVVNVDFVACIGIYLSAGPAP